MLPKVVGNAYPNEPHESSSRVLVKRVRSARNIFHERARDSSFDAKLETLTRESPDLVHHLARGQAMCSNLA
ncbi:hypothetical protein CR513_26716, partial [Mucuna pruriens]